MAGRNLLRQLLEHVVFWVFYQGFLQNVLPPSGVEVDKTNIVARDTTYTVLGVREWTFGIVNESLDANAQALVKMQISPDGINWLDEAGPVTINQNSLSTLVTSIFLKYARVYYSAVNAASAVTLNIFFQGEL